MPEENASMTPEQQAVAANSKAGGDKSAPAPKSVPSKAKAPAPKKIVDEKKQKSKTHFLIGCAGAFFLLFTLFILMMILMLSQGGGSNDVMELLGLNPAEIRAFLLFVVGFSFGSLAIFFFVLMLVGLFRMGNAPKGDTEARRRGGRMAALSSIPFVFVVLIWVMLFSFIFRIQIDAQRVIADIVVLNPSRVDNLVAPVEITFTAQGVADTLTLGGLVIEDMNWDLDGDGSFETPVGQPQITRLYTRRGNINVGLQVQVAGEEQYRIYDKLIVITDASFAANPPGGTAPLTIQFDASALIPEGSRVKSMDWDFEDDGFYEMQGRDNTRPRFTFDRIGDYRVHLRVVDEQNNVENYYRNIEIRSPETALLTANIETSPGLAGPAPFQVRFDGEGSRSLKGNVTSYEWDFGDGSAIQSGKTASHNFEQPGFYRVSLKVKDNMGNVAESSVDIESEQISSIPKAVIKTTPEHDLEQGLLKGTLPLKVTFDAGFSLDKDDDIVEYLWDIDSDGKTDYEGKTAVHTFELAGIHDVTLRVIDSQKQESEAKLSVSVSEPSIVAIISATPEEGTAPLTVQFDGSSSSVFVGRIVSYEWDFGDGSPSTLTGASIAHKYDQIGTYTVKLRILTNQGESAQTEHTIYVREVPMKACIEPSRETGKAPLTVTFDSKCSTGNVVGYNWDFGDGERSDSRKPTHTFEQAGTYTVTLEVNDDKNNVSKTTDVIVAEGELE